MTSIDPAVYVARPELLKLEADGDAYRELHGSLEWEAERATAITILAGYFNPGYIVHLLSDCFKSHPKIAN